MSRVYRSLDEVPGGVRAIAIGTFDGVHVGHRAVVERLLAVAEGESLRTTVVTFDRHPLAQIDPSRHPRLLTPLDEKIALLSELGAAEVVVLPFDEELAAMSASTFCRTVVSGRLGARVVVVGENFTFGAGGSAGPQELATAGQELGFRVDVVPLAVADDKTISSTRIRRLLGQGRLEEVRHILGRPPGTHGKVVGGWQRGRTLGVPTANLDVQAGLIFPGRGVYAGRVLVDGTWHRAAVNVGHNPTFQEADDDTTVVRIEAHLLDFSGDLYDKPIRVDFLHRIREEQRFESVDELIAQMRADIESTRTCSDPAFDEVGLA